MFTKRWNQIKNLRDLNLKANLNIHIILQKPQISNIFYIFQVEIEFSQKSHFHLIFFFIIVF